MSDWTAGYVSDIEYMPGYYGEQMPAHLDAVCLVASTEPPVRSGEPFSYCELGCGQGETAMAVAAGYRQAQVWGFDFNPAHIARGKRLAELGRLDNMHMEEASFEELNGPRWADLPQFDYVTMHGVWSWISRENRDHIVRFLARQLKPGGIAYVSYNAMPGWASVVPLQRLLSTVAGFERGRSDRRIVQGIDFARAALEAGAALPAELLEGIEKQRDAGNLSYLSHEYLNAHWSPCFHRDVAVDFAGAKLTFAASGNILENFPDISLSPKVRALVNAVPEEARETMKDYFMTRTFRRDIFIRGARPIQPRRREARLREQRLTLTIPASAAKREVEIPLGEAELSQRFYDPAFAELGRRIATVGELIDLPATAGSTATAQEIIGMMIGSKQVKAAPNDLDAEALARTRAYNSAHLRLCAEENRDRTALVGAAIGGALPVGLVEMLAYEALIDGTPEGPEAIVQACARILDKRGDRLRRENETSPEAANEDFLRDNIGKVLAVLPIWRRVGIL